MEFGTDVHCPQRISTDFGDPVTFTLNFEVDIFGPWQITSTTFGWISIKIGTHMSPLDNNFGNLSTFHLVPSSGHITDCLILGFEV